MNPDRIVISQRDRETLTVLRPVLDGHRSQAETGQGGQGAIGPGQAGRPAAWLAFRDAQPVRNRHGQDVQDLSGDLAT